MGIQPIRVLLADDHNLVRGGIAQILSAESDIQVVAEAADGAEAYHQAVQLKPDVILMDLDMPRMSGFESITRILERLPGCAIIVLTYSASSEDIQEALRRGARGYLLKSMEPKLLAEQVRKAVRGGAPMSAEVTRKLVTDLRPDPPAATSDPAPAPEAPAESGPLTPRELQIVALIARGATNREIGQQLFLAENTVKNHLKNIFAKLEVENRAQAVAWAMREGVLPE